MSHLFKWMIGVLALLGAAAASAGGVVKDCADCPAMVQIPAGSFMMGGDHQVSFAKPFFMATTMVTQAQWRAVMKKNPSEFARCGDQCPVERVSWDDAQVFILRLNAATGRHYRLPSEAEWEYACRAGGDSSYCGSNDVDQVAWFDGNSYNHTHPVAAKAANAWGLYDMSGNVWEWMEDCYQDTGRQIPDNGAAWEGDSSAGGECASRVVRGGAWNNAPPGLLVNWRSADDPSVRVHSIGLRLVRSQ